MIPIGVPLPWCPACGVCSDELVCWVCGEEYVEVCLLLVARSAGSAYTPLHILEEA